MFDGYKCQACSGYVVHGKCRESSNANSMALKNAGPVTDSEIDNPISLKNKPTKKPPVPPPESLAPQPEPVAKPADSPVSTFPAASGKAPTPSINVEHVKTLNLNGRICVMSDLHIGSSWLSVRINQTISICLTLCSSENLNVS